jgi:hypothetical protein
MESTYEKQQQQPASQNPTEASQTQDFPHTVIIDAGLGESCCAGARNGETRSRNWFQPYGDWMRTCVVVIRKVERAGVLAPEDVFVVLAMRCQRPVRKNAQGRPVAVLDICIDDRGSRAMGTIWQACAVTMYAHAMQSRSPNLFLFATVVDGDFRARIGRAIDPSVTHVRRMLRGVAWQRCRAGRASVFSREWDSRANSTTKE